MKGGTKNPATRTLTLAMIGGVILFCGSFYTREANQVEKSLLVQERSQVDVLARVLQYEFRPVADDLQQLANGDSLRAFLLAGRPDDLDRAVRQAVFFSRLNLDLDQIRYLNEQGREVLRVNRNGDVTPNGQLQDKSGRPYFQKASTLGPGELYLSAFDLNVENGRIEQPPKPMLRFATPVFDQAGRRRGVYVVNCLGSGCFAHLQDYRPELQHRLRMFNARGYWLKAAQPEQEWGFMFPERKDRTLARTEPELWKLVASEPSGQVRHAGGILSWRRIDPRRLVAVNPDLVIAEDVFLVVASEISKEEFRALFSRLKMVFGTLTVMLLVAAIFAGGLIHSRLLATQALRRSEEKLAVTLHSIGDAVLATDTRGRITRLNRVAQKMTGWSEAESLGQPVTTVFHIINEATRERAVVPVDKVLASGEIHGLANQTVIIARDGTERPIADSAAPIRDRDGSILGVVLVFRDVTEEHAAQRALRESEERYRTLFDSIDEGYCIIEMIFDERENPADFRFLVINPSFDKLTGLHDARGRRMLELVPQHEALWFENFGRVALTGEAIRFQSHAAQLHRWYDVYAFRFGDASNRQVAILFNDITERKRSEDRIAALHAGLQSQAAKLAEANEELESFSYSVSHDLRAPLRHVQGYVAMLQKATDGQLPEKATRYLKIIEGAGIEMGQLIDDLLEFSRMGRVELRATRANLDKILKDVIQGLDIATMGRNIIWKIEPLPDVLGDPALLKQVFSNLVGNALKYSRQRNPSEIGVGCCGEEGDRLILFVRDNGAGFDMQYAHKLFGVFQRLHRADEFEGTGIGLANVRRIIVRHGGRTWAESKLGEGATFFFTLKGATTATI